MQHTFSAIPRAMIPRSVFDRSHSVKTTFDEGRLVPVYLEEVLPGDSFKLDVNLFCRLTSPLQVPIVDDMDLDIHFFYVPFRLLWDNWERMNGQQDNPGDSTDYMTPIIKLDCKSSLKATWAQSVQDYFGVPLTNNASGSLDILAFPFRAYNLIYNEWYRDQNLQHSAPVWKGEDETEKQKVYKADGSVVEMTEAEYWNLGPAGNGDTVEGGTLKRRAKRHDYFTSCLPWPQKGPGVELPLGGVAPLGIYEITGNTASTSNIGNRLADFVGAGTIQGAIGSTYSFVSGDKLGTKNPYSVFQDGAGRVPWEQTNSSAVASVYGADLSFASAATINSLRQAFQLQKLYERDARGGTRYTEILRSHFGVVSPDARLQRPEYLGGSTQRVVINPVTQTSATNDTTPQANLAAFGVTGSSKRGFRKSFVEHGLIIGLVSVRSNLTYQQGLNRFLSRRTRFDFYWPALAHLGEQAVLNKEIFAQGTEKDDEVFGYQERWSEYRYHPSMITGKMRSTINTPLDFWHLGQKFDELPKLNSDFIVENAPLGRCVAVPSEPHFLLDVFFSCKAARPMPVYSVPGLIDHF